MGERKRAKKIDKERERQRERDREREEREKEKERKEREKREKRRQTEIDASSLPCVGAAVKNGEYDRPLAADLGIIYQRLQRVVLG
jgi:hypothetical protein